MQNDQSETVAGSVGTVKQPSCVLPCIFCTPPFPGMAQYQFLGTQSFLPPVDPPAVASRPPYTSPYNKLPSPSQAFPDYQSISSQAESITACPPPTAPVPVVPLPPQPISAYPPEKNSLQSDQTAVDRIFNMGGPGGAALDVDNLNTVINRVGHELRFLSEKSRECLYDKVKSLAQLKRMREGLKNTYNDVYNIQFALAAYQEQLKEMKEYLKKNRGRIVVVDNKQLGEMYSMVRRLQAAAEGMVSGSMRAQCTQTS